MYNYFECVVKMNKTAETGQEISVKQHFIVDAITHAEAENRIVKEIQPFTNQPLCVDAVKRVSISEIFGIGNGGIWYKVKVLFMIFDESGKEKVSKSTFYINAENIESAIENIHEEMKTTSSNYHIVAVIETPIVEVFEYEEEKQKPEFYDVKATPVAELNLVD